MSAEVGEGGKAQLIKKKKKDPRRKATNRGFPQKLPGLWYMRWLYGDKEVYKSVCVCGVEEKKKKST